MQPGNIILLNGTSSAGKTTLAKMLQNMMDEPYLHTGNDQFLQNRPDNLLVYSDETSTTQVDGWLAVFREGNFMDLEVGPVGLRWLRGMYCAMAAWSEAGNHLIGDVVLHERRILQAAVEELHHLPVWLVSVYCLLEVAEQREQVRADMRAPGGARLFYQGVYGHGVYDLLIDTTTNSPEECAWQIRHYVQTGPPPDALRRLHIQFLAD